MIGLVDRHAYVHILYSLIVRRIRRKCCFECSSRGNDITHALRAGCPCPGSRRVAFRILPFQRDIRQGLAVGRGQACRSVRGRIRLGNRVLHARGRGAVPLANRHTGGVFSHVGGCCGKGFAVLGIYNGICSGKSGGVVRAQRRGLVLAVIGEIRRGADRERQARGDAAAIGAGCRDGAVSGGVGEVVYMQGKRRRHGHVPLWHLEGILAVVVFHDVHRNAAARHLIAQCLKRIAIFRGDIEGNSNALRRRAGGRGDRAALPDVIHADGISFHQRFVFDVRQLIVAQRARVGRAFTVRENVVSLHGQRGIAVGLQGIVVT